MLQAADLSKYHSLEAARLMHDRSLALCLLYTKSRVRSCGQVDRREPYARQQIDFVMRLELLRFASLNRGSPTVAYGEVRWFECHPGVRNPGRLPSEYVTMRTGGKSVYVSATGYEAA